MATCAQRRRAPCAPAPYQRGACLRGCVPLGIPLLFQPGRRARTSSLAQVAVRLRSRARDMHDLCARQVPCMCSSAMLCEQLGSSHPEPGAEAAQSTVRSLRCTCDLGGQLCLRGLRALWAGSRSLVHAPACQLSLLASPARMPGGSQLRPASALLPMSAVRLRRCFHSWSALVSILGPCCSVSVTFLQVRVAPCQCFG